MDSRTRPRPGRDARPGIPRQAAAATATAAATAPADPGVDGVAARMLERPAGTTMRLLLLVAMIALSAAFVGNWMFLSVSDGVVPGWQWLTLPPVATLAIAMLLTWAAPAWLERRHGWVPVPPERGATALARVDALAGEAGLRETPRLMWDPREDRTRALAYGRPGDPRLALSPVLLGAARRRPAAFDAVVRHELAHVRHRDVVPAYFAIVVWYVLLAALSVPLLWRVVDRDLSLVPDYLVRVALLALVVAWVRADLLRTREGYADVRASLTVQHRTDLLAGLEAPTPPRAGRRPWHAFPLHPSPAARAAVVRDPGRLGRLDPGELCAVGLTATWSVPLLAELLVRAGLAPLHAERVTHLAVFALVGAYVAAAMLRRAGATESRPGPSAPAALALGLALGPAVSIAGTGLLVRAPGELLGAALTAAVVAAYAVWVGDLSMVLTGAGRAWSRARGRLVVAVGAGALALVAATVLPASESLRLGASRLLTDDPVRALASSTDSVVLVLAVPAVSLVALLAHSRRRALTAAVTGVLLGAAATAVVAGVRGRVDLADDPAKLRYYLATVLVAGGAAALAAVVLASGRGRGSLLAAHVAAWVTVLVAAVGWLGMEDLGFGSTLEAQDLRGLLREAWPTGALLAALPAAVAWLLTREAPDRGRRRAPIVLGSVVAVALGAATVTLAPAVVDGPARDRGEIAELRQYVGTDVPVLLQRRDAAESERRQAMGLDPALVPEALEAVLSRYDELVADLDERRLDHPLALEVQADLRTLLLAERDRVAVERDVLAGVGTGEEYLAVLERADTATYTWAMTYQEARDHVGGP